MTKHTSTPQPYPHVFGPHVWLAGTTADPDHVAVHVDPAHRHDFDATSREEVGEVLGLVPAIFGEAVAELMRTPSDARTTDALARCISNAYGFGTVTTPASRSGLVIAADGAYCSPKDEPLYPLAAMRAPCAAQLIQYPYGLVIFRVGRGEWTHTRLD